MGFPHSEISGSKVARHLPEAYRSYATSFIATFSQGIHRTPLNFLLRNLKTIAILPTTAGWENLTYLETHKKTLEAPPIAFCFQSSIRPENTLWDPSPTLRVNKKPPSGGRYKQRELANAAFWMCC